MRSNTTFVPNSDGSFEHISFSFETASIFIYKTEVSAVEITDF